MFANANSTRGGSASRGTQASSATSSAGRASRRQAPLPVEVDGRVALWAVRVRERAQKLARLQVEAGFAKLPAERLHRLLAFIHEPAQEIPEAAPGSKARRARRIRPWSSRTSALTVGAGFAYSWKPQDGQRTAPSPCSSGA